VVRTFYCISSSTNACCLLNKFLEVCCDLHGLLFKYICTYFVLLMKVPFYKADFSEFLCDVTILLKFILLDANS